MKIGLVNSDKNLFYFGTLFFLSIAIIAFLFDLPILFAIPFLIPIIFIFLRDIRYVFYALMFSIPLSFQFLDKYDFPDEPLMLITSILFFFFILFNYKKIEFKNLLLNPIIIMVLLSFLWLILSVLFSTDIILSSKFLIKKIWYLIPFFFFPIFLFQDKKVMITSFQLLYFSLFFVVLFVMIRHGAVGFSFEKMHDPVQPFFQNHVMYGSMVSIMIPLVLASFFLSRKLSVQWLLALLGIVLFFVAVYFSYSRAAWVAVIFSFICFLSVRFRMIQWTIIGFYFLIGSLVYWLSHNNTYLTYKPKFEKTIMHESLEDHIMATIQGTDISSAERYYRWIAAIRMSRENPIFGVGPNNFYENYKAYTITSFRTWVSRNPERSTTHNYFLFMLVEQGIPGMLLYALFIFIIFYYGQKVYHRQSERFSRFAVMAAICVIAAVFINNFFSELLETDKIGSVLYLCVALIVAMDIRQKKLNIQSP